MEWMAIHLSAKIYETREGNYVIVEKG